MSITDPLTYELASVFTYKYLIVNYTKTKTLVSKKNVKGNSPREI